MRRTAWAWLSMFARRFRSPSRFSPSSMSARRTIWTLTGSFSVVVAFPAKTRARSSASWGRIRRTLVLFANIPVAPPRGSRRGFRYITSTYYIIYSVRGWASAELMPSVPPPDRLAGRLPDAGPMSQEQGGEPSLGAAGEPDNSRGFPRRAGGPKGPVIETMGDTDTRGHDP